MGCEAAPGFVRSNAAASLTAGSRQIAGKPSSYGLRPESKALRGAARCRFCPQGVGALLAGDVLRSGPRVCLIQRSCKSYCLFPADRWQAKLLRPPARIKSASRRCTGPLLPAGRRSLACRRWAAKRPQGLSDPTQLQVLLPVPGRSLASQAPTAFGQNQKRFAGREAALIPCA